MKIAIIVVRLFRLKSIFKLFCSRGGDHVFSSWTGASGLEEGPLSNMHGQQGASDYVDSSQRLDPKLLRLARCW